MRTRRTDPARWSRWRRATLGLTVFLAVLATVGSAWAADVAVRPRWAVRTPLINGVVSTGEWADAQMTPLKMAAMYTKNNGKYLFILLDFWKDTFSDPVGGDYYVLAFDVDRNRAVSPNVDLIYDSCQDGRPFTKAYYLSASTYTGCKATDPNSAGVYGFGPTPGHPVKHRFYEFRLALTEIGIDPSAWTTSAGEIAIARLHVALVSRAPALGSYQPQNRKFPLLPDSYYQIGLATLPSYPGGAGLAFAGVGLVPKNYIFGGYANINMPSYYVATDAPFGGKLNVFGNWPYLRARGAASYKVWYRRNPGAWAELKQTWTNFQFIGGNWVPVAVGPDPVTGRYAVPSAAIIWYLPNLLVGWQSDQFPDGLYDLRLALFNAAGNPIADPPANLLRLAVINTPPEVKINRVLYNGVEQNACSIVRQGLAPSGFTFDISATDGRGALGTFVLQAIHGANLSEAIYSDGYSSHVNESGPHLWNGVSNLIVPVVPPAARWRAPESCAYSFILSASSRSQNGYGLVFPYVDYHVSLTIETFTIDGPAALCGKPAAEEACPACNPSGL